MSALYGALADAVLVLHALFVAFVGVGGLLVLRWPRLALLHLPAAAWGALISAMGWICPLTPLENALRRAAGRSVYEGSFIEQHLLPLIYPATLTRELQLGMAAAVVLVNGLVYGVLIARRLRARESRAAGVRGERK